MSLFEWLVIGSLAILILSVWVGIAALFQIDEDTQRVETRVEGVRGHLQDIQELLIDLPSDLKR